LCEESNFSYDVVNRLIFRYGFQRTVNFIEKLRQPPKKIPLRVNTNFTTAEKLIEHLKEKNITVEQHPILSDCLMVEMIGPEKLKRKDKEVQIKFSKKVNDVLTGGNLSFRDFIPDEDLKIGDEVSIVDNKGEVLANGIVMMRFEEIQNKKKGAAIKVVESRYRFPPLKTIKEYLRGQFIRQSLGSILIGAQIQLKPKARVLFLNSGAGELLTYVWQRNQTVKETKFIAFDQAEGNWLMFDTTIKRLRLYKLPVERFKLSFAGFARKFNRDETFDVIILDGPSTGLGFRPKIFEQLREKQILRTIEQQRKYLHEAARLLKKGGTLFYLTNSLDPAENENNIKFAQEELSLTIVPQEIFIGEQPEGMLFKGAEKLQYLYPDRLDCDGQFIAKLTK